MQYQNWSSGIDRFDELLDCGEDQNGGSGNLSSVASKLDPNSKPFAPRQPPFPPSKTAGSPTTCKSCSFTQTSRFPDQNSIHRYIKFYFFAT